MEIIQNSIRADEILEEEIIKREMERYYDFQEFMQAKEDERSEEKNTDTE